MRLVSKTLAAAALCAVAITLSCQGGDSPTPTPTTDLSLQLNAGSPTPARPTSTPAPTATATPFGPPGLSCGGPDTDSDGLPDCYELEIGTSVSDTDTDGDGLTDFEEVVDKEFDAAADNFRFNPLIADVPQISFELVSVPEISIRYTNSNGQPVTIANTGNEQTASQARTSHTSHDSLSFEAGGNPFPASPVSLTNSWTPEQARENRRAHTLAMSTTSSNTVQARSGEFAVALKVVNGGSQAMTLQSLGIAAFQGTQRRQPELVPVGSLQLNGEFSPVEIAAGGETPGTLSFSSSLTYGRALDMLSDTGSIVLQATAWEATDADGRAYSQDLAGIWEKNARITIDYGPRIEAETGRATESYYVSTVGDSESQGITVEKALRDVLKLPYETGSTPWGIPGTVENTYDGLLSVRGVGTDPWPRARWIAVLGSHGDNRASQTAQVFDNLEAAYDFSQVELHSGSSLLLMFVEDGDGDGILSREEFAYGTSDNDPDSDNDGLTDFQEIREGWPIPLTRTLSRQVFSDPLEPDADGDRLLDGQEKARSSDPYERDTDGDGIRDTQDDEIVAEDMSEVAHFAFNGSLADTAGGPATAVLDGATYGEDRFGAGDSALYLNGAWDTTGHNFEPPPGSSLEINGLYEEAPESGASWSFWMLAEEMHGQSILNSGVHNGRDRVALWMEEDGALYLLGSNVGWHQISTEQPVSGPGEWLFVTVVLSDEDITPGAERISLYLDGELFVSMADSRECCLAVSPGPWTFGLPSPFIPEQEITESFKGWIDDFRYFSRSLNAHEVQALYEVQ